MCAVRSQVGNNEYATSGQTFKIKAAEHKNKHVANVVKRWQFAHNLTSNKYVSYRQVNFS